MVRVSMGCTPYTLEAAMLAQLYGLLFVLAVVQTGFFLAELLRWTSPPLWEAHPHKLIPQALLTGAGYSIVGMAIAKIAGIEAPTSGEDVTVLSGFFTVLIVWFLIMFSWAYSILGLAALRKNGGVLANVPALAKSVVISSLVMGLLFVLLV